MAGAGAQPQHASIPTVSATDHLPAPRFSSRRKPGPITTGDRWIKNKKEITVTSRNHCSRWLWVLACQAVQKRERSLLDSSEEVSGLRLGKA
jgi:hypothetical protein